MRQLLSRLVKGIARRTTTRWDDALLGHGTFHWLARAVPSLVLQGIVLVPDVPARTEALTGNVMTSLLMFCLVLAVVVGAALVAGAVMLQSIVAIALAVVVVVAGLILLALIQSSLHGIYAAALYRYAETGETSVGFDQALLQQAFRARKK